MRRQRGKNNTADSNVNVLTDAVPMPAMDCVAKAEARDPREDARELAKLEALYVSLNGIYFDGVWEFKSKLGAAITERRLGR